MAVTLRILLGGKAMKKKILALLLSSAMLLTPVSAAHADEFSGEAAEFAAGEALQVQEPLTEEAGSVQPEGDFGEIPAVTESPEPTEIPDAEEAGEQETADPEKEASKGEFGDQDGEATEAKPGEEPEEKDGAEAFQESGEAVFRDETEEAVFGELFEDGQETQAGSISYSFDKASGILTVKGMGNIADYESEYDVPWKEYSSDANKIVIGEGITYVGERAFQGFTFVTSISLPSTLEEIGAYAFSGIWNLTSIQLPESLEMINSFAFEETDIKQVFIPANVWLIGPYAFPEKTRITTEDPNMQVQDSEGTMINTYPLSLLSYFDYGQAYQVLDLVNQQRAQYGLGSLTMDQDLLNAAMQRAAEISVRFDHDRPNGLPCYSACWDKMYGENIAAGQISPAMVMNSWMNSEGHRANILSRNYQSVGIGVVQVEGTWYWTQCFGGDNIAQALPSYYSNAWKYAEVKMIRAPISMCDISLSHTTMGYVGQEMRPAVTVSFEGMNLVQGEDYTVQYSNNINPGTATVTITGLGIVTGSVKKTFKIVLGTPVLKSAAASGYNQVKVSWDPVIGADSYRVYYKVPGGSWKIVKSGVKGTSFTHVGSAAAPLQVGQTYVYTVRAQKGNSLGGFDKAGKSAKAVFAKPELISASRADYNKITIKWKKVEGATHYLIYRKQGSGSWRRIAKINGNNSSYTQTGSTNFPIVCGTYYTYTVRAYTTLGNTSSPFDAKGVTAKAYPGRPELVSAASTGQGKITIKWKPVAGATHYWICRKDGNRWRKVATVDGSVSSYVHANSAKFPVKKGQTYTYTVRSYNSGGGANGYGLYNSAGIQVTAAK